jgi:hypothetical protein
MTNKFASGAQMTPRGWIAWYRDPIWPENRVLRDGKYDIIFPSKEEAKDAGHDALMAHLNGNMTADTNVAPRPTSKEVKFAAATKQLFVGGGKSVIVEKVGRKGKEISVERREMA